MVEISDEKLTSILGNVRLHYEKFHQRDINMIRMALHDIEQRLVEWFILVDDDFDKTEFFEAIGKIAYPEGEA